MQCVICIEGPLWNICTFISMICLIYQISKKGVFFREKLDQIGSSGEEKIMHVCVCVCSGESVC